MQEALAESLASFTAQAVAKLRRHALLAAGYNIYAQIFAEGGRISPERGEPRKRSLEGCDCVGRTVVFPAPTDTTNEILRAISNEVKHLYLPGVRYRKTGIVFFSLEKPGTAHQFDLFADSSTPASRQSALYKAVDALNAKYGKGKVFSARRVRFPMGREPPQGVVTPKASAKNHGTSKSKSSPPDLQPDGMNL